MITQKLLSQNQIEDFYHDEFVANQAGDFIALLGSVATESVNKVIDIGGGCGFFAEALQNITNFTVRVLETDNQAINICEQKNVEAVYGDALKPIIVGDEHIICFNLILHHLVGESEYETYNMQGKALSVWHSSSCVIFINEYIYESFGMSKFSGWLIYQITSNSILSKLCELLSKFMPSLKANTFGVGVRFRSHEEWCKMFELLGFEVVDKKIGKQEKVSLPRRLLLIKNCRRDSFLLKPIFM